MDILNTRINYFLGAAEEPSFLAAAAKLGITQPTLSSAIKCLEEELSTTLFERSVSGVRLTPKGKRLYDELKTHRSSIESSLQVAILEQQEPVLKIGAAIHLGSKFLIPYIARNKETHSPIFHLYLDYSKNCLDEVKKGNLDFAFITWTSDLREKGCEKLISDPTRILGHKDSFPSLSQMNTFKQLKNFPWAYMPKPQHDWTHYLQFNKSTFMCKHFSAVKESILNGLAISSVQVHFFKDNEFENLIAASFPAIYHQTNIYLVKRPGLSQEMEKLIGELKNEIVEEISQSNKYIEQHFEYF